MLLPWPLCVLQDELVMGHDDALLEVLDVAFTVDFWVDVAVVSPCAQNEVVFAPVGRGELGHGHAQDGQEDNITPDWCAEA